MPVPAMRIAFVERIIRFSIPLGPAGLAALLRRDGHTVDVFALGRDPSRTLREILAWKPDMAGISSLSGDHLALLAFAQKLKEARPLPVVFGGPHPTFFPEIVERPEVDAVCRGEGEEAMREFAGRCEADGGSLPTDVRNIWVKTGGGISRNPVRPRLQALDELPWAARDLYFRKFPFLRDHGVKHFLAHRGCPHGCTYCFNGAYNTLYREETGERRVYVSRSPESLVEEILAVRREAPMRMVGFVDDSFTLDRAWTLAFAEEYARRCRLPFSVNARFETLTEETVAALADAGLRLAYCGVESGDERFRNGLLRRGMDEECMQAAAERCRRHGVKLLTENIIGLPGEAWDAARRTLDLNNRLKPDIANVSMFMPYPGLPLTAHAIRHGWFDGDYDRLYGNYYHQSALRFPSARDRIRILNLRCFFSLLAHHPRLLPLFSPLMDLPPNPLFRLAGDLLDGYYLWRCLAYRMSAVEFARTLLQFLGAYR